MSSLPEWFQELLVAALLAAVSSEGIAAFCDPKTDRPREVIGAWKWSMAPCTRRIEREGASYMMYSWCEGLETEGEIPLVSLGPQRFANAIGTMTFELSSDGYLALIDEGGRIHSIWSPLPDPCAK
jgi:hypothetical protein